MILRRGTDRGSVLMLFPAAVVIILMLGALVVDSAIVYLAQRHAHSIALDAANDAAGAALHGSSFRGGEVRVDADRAAAIAADAVAASDADGIHLSDVTVSADGAVTVTVSYEVERLFGAAFGLGDSTESIRATSTGDTGDGE